MKKNSLIEKFEKVERINVHCPGNMAQYRVLSWYGKGYGRIDYYYDYEQFQRCGRLSNSYVEQCGGAISLEKKVGRSWVEVERIEY